MLTRKPHWATRELHEFLLARHHTPFLWGSHDCALFVADAVEAMTGVDIADDFRGKYSDEQGAFTAIRAVLSKPAYASVTVADAIEHCAIKHGLQELERPLFAARGDLVTLQESGRMIAGLVHLSGRHIVCAGEKGLHRLPISLVVRAWHV